MPIVWTDILWVPLGMLAALVFLCSLIGNSLSKNAFVGSIITVILFVAAYIFLVYYPNLPPIVRLPKMV